MKTTNEIIAGALYDFAASLTCREGSLTVGSTHNAAPMAEAVSDFCKARGLTGEPAVRDWEKHAATLCPMTGVGEAKPHAPCNHDAPPAIDPGAMTVAQWREGFVKSAVREMVGDFIRNNRAMLIKGIGKTGGSAVMLSRESMYGVGGGVGIGNSLSLRTGFPVTLAPRHEKVQSDFELVNSDSGIVATRYVRSMVNDHAYANVVLTGEEMHTLAPGGTLTVDYGGPAGAKEIFYFNGGSLSRRINIGHAWFECALHEKPDSIAARIRAFFAGKEMPKAEVPASFYALGNCDGDHGGPACADPACWHR